MNFRSSKIRLAVAALAIGGLSLTAGCFTVPVEDSPNPCVTAHVEQLQRELDATNAAINAKEAIANDTNNPQFVRDAAQAAADHLTTVAKDLDDQLSLCIKY
jgi:hypothetical protein